MTDTTAPRRGGRGAGERIAAAAARLFYRQGINATGVDALITEAAQRARAVIKANLSSLEKLKEALLEKETVEAAEVAELLTATHLPKEAALY